MVLPARSANRVSFLDQYGADPYNQSLSPDASPLDNPTLPDLSSLTPSPSGLNSALTGLQRKYSRDLPAIESAGYSPGIVRALINFETERAKRGINPVSRKKTAALLQAAQTHQAVAAPPERDSGDLLGNFASDVGDLVSSIPKIPSAIIHDVTHVGDIAKAHSLTDLLQAPLIRLLPGTFTASNILKGDFNNALSHPLMTALDVLPVASELGVGEKLAALPIGERTVGDILEQGKNALKMTTGGRLARQTWGLDTRGLSKTLAEGSVDVIRAANPALHKFFDDSLSTIRQQGTRAAHSLDNAVIDNVGKSTEAIAERHAQLFTAAENGSLYTDPHLNLTDAERGAVGDVMSVRDRLRQLSLDAGDLHNRMAPDGTTETYSSPQARRIDKLRAAVARREVFTTAREAIMHPETADLNALHGKVQAFMDDATNTVAAQKRLAKGYVHALNAAGYDTGDLLTNATRITRSTAPDFLPDPATMTSRPADTALATRSTKAADTWAIDHRTYTPKSLERAQRQSLASEAKVVPARWQPIVSTTKQEAVRGAITRNIPASDPRVPELMQLVDERNYGLLRDRGLITDADLRTYESEAIKQIADLRARGIEPEYVHHVSPGAAASMSRPKLSSMVPKPSQLRDRINDWTPHVENLSVALSHQGMELARESVAKSTVAKIGESFTKTAAEAREELLPIARRAAIRRGTAVGVELERLMSKEYVRWSETENGFVASSAHAPTFTELNRIAPDERLIPRHLSDALMQVARPNPISRLFDPALKVFRYSVLPFSVRFQVNNIGGGAIMSALEDPRVLLHLNQGFKVAKDNYAMTRAMAHDMTGELSADSEAILSRMSPSMRSSLGTLEYSVEPETLGKINPEKLFNFKTGQQAGRWFNQAGKAIGRAADWSYGINQLWDDAYRAAAYLSGEKSALTKGMTAEEAARAGEELVNKIQPRWLEMTPMERSILRPIIPFYSFLSHVFRYATRFPIDHPWRTAVMGGLARAEVNDLGTGLPQMFASMFGLGADASGKENFIDIGAMNPFRNLGDDMTIAGFASELNPAFKVALSQLGYDAAARGPDLYPQLEYDPKTGKFKSKTPDTPGLLGQAIQGFIPQANILSALIGTNGEFKAMMQTNPNAAIKMLLSNAGIPLLWRNVDLNQEAFKSELNREDVQQKALSRAIRSGDYSDAHRYPTLSPYLDQLSQLQGTGQQTSDNQNLNQYEQSILTGVR